MDMNKSNFQLNKGTLFFGLILIFVLFSSSTAYAQKGSIEYKIKAGYIYNFTKFISWPENKLETFNLCILGKDPFGSIIEPIEKRKVKDKPIRVYRLRSIDHIKLCHIVYFSGTFSKWRNNHTLLPGILTINSLKKTLSGSESKEFLQTGGMIAFSLKHGKVKLHINLQALRKSDLEISAKLLEVAEVYKEESND